MLVRSGSRVFPASSRTTRSKPRILRVHTDRSQLQQIKLYSGLCLTAAPRGSVPVSIINLCCDFLLQLHKVVLRQRSRHDLRSILDEAVGHLLNAPEQGGSVRLSDGERNIITGMTSGVKHQHERPTRGTYHEQLVPYLRPFPQSRPELLHQGQIRRDDYFLLAN